MIVAILKIKDNGSIRKGSPVGKPFNYFACTQKITGLPRASMMMAVVYKYDHLCWM